MKTIKIIEDVRVPGTNVILEEGDEIEVLKEEAIDFIDIRNIDWRPLISKMKSIGISVQSIEGRIEEKRRKALRADVSPVFEGKDLGVFQAGVKKAVVEVFNSEVQDGNTGIIWWATWVLNIKLSEGGENGISFLTSWYNFDTQEWNFR